MEEKALSSVLEKFKFDIKLKEEQQNIIFSILRKMDVFALLPTGFGKSMTYILVPLLADEVSRSTLRLFLYVSKNLISSEWQRSKVIFCIF